ncbi:hypothetical protein QAD02_016140 [Eretmocerus hayati]|uniref:Uncharacterized protein n=1 Tax=Eretmocerus hayati TaxID=131215 RepID=A0ACC2PB73_9HYME|nr:hypothetical protein QAD02_016140 [Eretmocerus hayati]
MSGQSGGARLRLATLNEHLTCKLCGGYYIDATSLNDCLHTFCKSCIVKHLEKNKHCPVCEVLIHKSKPLLNIRPDHILQDIVYKLVPGCYQNEMRLRKEFYEKHPEEKSKVQTPEACGEPIESYIFSPDESLSLSLEYFAPQVAEETDDKESASKLLPKRYLRCPAAVTVFHLQKLIRAKYGLSEAHRVDIMYEDEILRTSYSLMDIMYIYHWRRKVPLHLSYRIFESAPKRMRISEDNDVYKKTLSSSHVEIDSKDDEDSVKREWKEVQLKISETGEMSVTDISNLDAKKGTSVDETSEQTNNNLSSSSSRSVNKTVVKTEEKESIKNSTSQSRNRKVPQETMNKNKKNERTREGKSSTVSSSAITANKSDSKNKLMEVKPINQLDLSNELLKVRKDGCDEKSATGDSKDGFLKSNKSDEESTDNKLSQQSRIKSEPIASEEKRSESNDNVSKSTSKNSKLKGDSKQSSKSSDTKSQNQAGSKINALSAKLQFQPKIGQVNNTYSKKLSASDKKLSSSTSKVTDIKGSKPESKVNVKSSPPHVEPADSEETKPPTSNSGLAANTSSLNTQTSQSMSTSNKQTPNRQASSGQKLPSAPSTESLASIGLHVSTTMPSQSSPGWMSPRTYPSKELSADQQVRSLPGMPPLGKDIVCSTTSGGTPSSSMPRYSIQKPSMSIYSIPPSSTKSSSSLTSASPAHSYGNSSPAKQSPKSSFDVTSVFPVPPPCPDAIPISLMKPTSAKKDAHSKGSTLNEICAKISSANSGSKINDICAKIGENSKEKCKLEAQRNKPDMPELLKIQRSSPTMSGTEVSGSSSPIKHIPNIPNVPIYTPSNTQTLQASVDAKDNAKRLTSAMTSSQVAMMTAQLHQLQKTASQKKPSQAVGYKTLRDPPKSWNPTLSKNNYVVAKNQAQANFGLSDGSSTAKIPSKPAKIFKNRNNMPRFLGNPASGVKPMYGVMNEQSKEKDQVNATKNPSSMSISKIDPQTLSPIVSSPNSPIVSPPPYSPSSSRSYQNRPFPRDICRNSNSPISPRNSPVNMLSTNPFIPSHTPNTNPTLLYSHFPPGTFADTSRFSNNPLIRSPIGIPQIPQSAFHSSLPPSINKLYQRSNYLVAQSQAQNAIAAQIAATVAAATQPPAVQRIPPSGHSPSPFTPSSPPTKTSPSSKSISNTSSVSPSSIVDSVALQLAKGLVQQQQQQQQSSKLQQQLKQSAQRDLNAFDLTKVDNVNSNSNAKQTSPSKSNESAAVTTVEESRKKSEEKSIEGKESNSAMSLTNASTSDHKEADEKDKTPAKLNGGASNTSINNEKAKNTQPSPEKSEEKSKEPDSKKASDAAEHKPVCNNMSKQDVEKADVKLTIDAQQNQECKVSDSPKVVTKEIISGAQTGQVES